MAAIARTVFRRVPTETEFEAFRTVVMFCAAGLFASLLVATYGVEPRFLLIVMAGDLPCGTS